VYLFDLVLGLGTAMVVIDPKASTGIFAGATGLLYTMDLKANPAQGPPPITYYDAVVGHVCFARKSAPRER
jgi:hypothetical protein